MITGGHVAIRNAMYIYVRMILECAHTIMVRILSNAIECHARNSHEPDAQRTIFTAALATEQSHVQVRGGAELTRPVATPQNPGLPLDDLLSLPCNS